MAALDLETRIVQNSALGAVLLWRFTSGYERENKVKGPPPIPLLFIVLPIMFHQDTAEIIISTRRSSGLRAFVNKFASSKSSKNDLILAINDRAIIMRNLSMRSLRLALASNLISIDIERGLAIPLTSTAPKAGVARSIRSMLQSAERLGYWCSQLSLYEVSAILKVRF